MGLSLSKLDRFKMEYECKAESHVVITLKNGTMYQGTVKRYTEQKEILSLESLKNFLGNDASDELRNITSEEIADLKIIKHFQVVPHSEPESEIELEPKRKKRKILFGDYFKILTIQRFFHYISDTGTLFYTGWADIRMCKMVAFTGRSGKFRRQDMKVLAFGTERAIYIFDLKKLDDEVSFQVALKSVLETNKIIKVVYDCRILSRFLQRKYHININNIRDVAAEDTVMVYSNTDVVLKRNRPLRTLIQAYLGSPTYPVDEKITEPWDNIAHSDKLQSNLAKHVSYLMPIHRNMEKLLLEKLTNASELYKLMIRDQENFSQAMINCDHRTYQQMLHFLLPLKDSDSPTLPR